ncbi:hypothetical protein MRX96_001054 [Rhipicephalus microplus]|uniref:RING-type domain-containing protein n=1 Tax=Rhipicephalus microplus TaxID=6941 RepID=A0A9J6EUT0_RHIMP|nr:uncharacterized protein LOC119179681 [Rhipicephalus microplus]KAH8037951.1 hypothetical protein HPB51_019303 [Rhipicephalus microplus]
MASASYIHTVFGFGTGLDWRPTAFVDPFPPYRVCSVCGLVPQAITTLPCGHHFCRPCFDSAISIRRKRCPIDNESFESSDDVQWSTLSRNSVLELTVRCWNARRGCVVEDTASAMLDHFASACRFHSVKCNTCGASVLHRGVWNHVASGCHMATVDIDRSVNENSANALMEVRDLLSNLSRDNASLQRRLNSFEERLSAKLDRTATSVAELTEDTVRTQLAGHLSSVTSAIERQQSLNNVATKQLLASEYRNNLFSLNATIKEAIAEGSRRVTDTFPSEIAAVLTEEVCELARVLSKQSTLKGDDASEVLKLLAAAAFGDTNKALVEKPQTRPWQIDDWGCFTYSMNGRGRHRREDRFGIPYYLDGRLVVPRLCFYPRTDTIQYSPYIIEGLYDKFLLEPKKPSCVRFIHPSGNSPDMKFTGEFTWVKPEHLGLDIVHMGSRVLYLGRESIPIDVAALETGGFIVNDTAYLHIYHQ